MKSEGGERGSGKSISSAMSRWLHCFTPAPQRGAGALENHEPLAARGTSSPLQRGGNEEGCLVNRWQFLGGSGIEPGSLAQGRAARKTKRRHWTKGKTKSSSDTPSKHIITIHYPQINTHYCIATADPLSINQPSDPRHRMILQLIMRFQCQCCVPGRSTAST